MNLIDSHAHLTSAEVYPDIDAILARAQAVGIKAIVNICTDPETLERGLKLRQSTPWIFNAAATHPHDVEKEGERQFSYFAAHARNGHLIAIGETGLDYHYQHSPREVQKQFLIKYLHLAQECQLPVIIHCREAFADFFEIVDAEYKGLGIMHCFTGTLEEAAKVIDRGWYLSLSGVVTFKKSHELREVAKMVPLDRLLIETDTPFLAPQSHRGKRNEPSYLPEIAKCIAEARGESVEKIAQITTNNTKQLLQFS